MVQCSRKHWTKNNQRHKRQAKRETDCLDTLPLLTTRTVWQQCSTFNFGVHKKTVKVMKWCDTVSNLDPELKKGLVGGVWNKPKPIVSCNTSVVKTLSNAPWAQEAWRPEETDTWWERHHFRIEHWPQEKEIIPFPAIDSMVWHSKWSIGWEPQNDSIAIDAMLLHVFAARCLQQLVLSGHFPLGSICMSFSGWCIALQCTYLPWYFFLPRITLLNAFPWQD
jgi:hypothetical protein